MFQLKHVPSVCAFVIDKYSNLGTATRKKVVTTVESVHESKSDNASLLTDTIVRAKLWLQERIYM